MRNQLITICSSAAITFVLGLIFIKPETIQKIPETTMIGLVLFMTSLAALCMFLAINFDRIFPDKNQKEKSVKQ